MLNSFGGEIQTYKTCLWFFILSRQRNSVKAKSCDCSTFLQTWEAQYPLHFGPSIWNSLSVVGIPVFTATCILDLRPTQFLIWSILYMQLFLQNITNRRLTLISHFRFVSGLRMCEDLLQFPLHAFFSHWGSNWSICICLLISWTQISSSDTFRYYSISE